MILPARTGLNNQTNLVEVPIRRDSCTYAFPVSTCELRTQTISLCERGRNEANGRRKPKDLRFSTLQAPMFPKARLGADHLDSILFCNAERKRRNIIDRRRGNSEKNTRDLIQHTRTHSIPSKAPNFFNLLETWPTPTAQ